MNVHYNYPPIRMNKTAAAAYMGVSHSTFDKKYRHRLEETNDGGVIYFLRTHLEALAVVIHDEYQEQEKQQSSRRERAATKRTQTPAPSKVIGAFDRVVQQRG